MKPSPHLVIVAGEDSGDLHGANLAKALRRLLPACRLSGIGGEKMAENGVELIFPSKRLAVVGIFEVLSRVGDIFRGARGIRRHLAASRPDLLILIDFPDFNLNLVAPFARRLRIPIVYYISPQLWAWRQGRINKIQRLVKKILVILPFEEDFYRRRQVTKVEYVGHPLLDQFKNFHLPPLRERPDIALIPGSRQGEIKRILPLMIYAARLYLREKPGTHFRIPVAPSIDINDIEKMIPAAFRKHVSMQKISLTETLSKVSFALVASGTATLETALAGIPMVVIYRVNELSYQIGRRLISVPFISLVNLIAGREIVPELIQREARPETIARQMRQTLDHRNNYRQTCHALASVREKLERIGTSASPSENAAQALCKILREESGQHQ
ncbi:MAG: lipid-A-disaccharide synthase [Deltaproteobacteria bacterium]|nr:lipid-A-disaccharide synthase [Deltaproteobacteria bacterium]